jgi:hypothetical protein
MDARIDRDAQLKQSISLSKKPEQTWYEWFWGIQAPKKATPVDIATSEALKTAFTQMLDQVEPPDVFKPSEVATQLTDQQLADLGLKTWEEALPGVYCLAFEEREFGTCELLRKGKVLGDDVTLADIDGPIRIRRAM